MRDILKALRPLKNRMHVNAALKCILYCFIGANAVSIAISILSVFVPITSLSRKITFVYEAFFGAALAASVIFRPRNLKVIKKADSFDGKERFITACEMEGDTSSIAILQRNDALAAARKMNFRILCPVRLRFELFLSGMLLLFFLAGTFYIPSAPRKRASDLEAFRKELAVQYSGFESERLKLDGMEYLDNEELSEINRKLDGLKKELMNAKSEEEAIKALSRARNEILRLKAENWRKKMESIADALKNSPQTREIADMVQKGSRSDLKSILEKFKNNLKDMSDRERAELAEELRQASGQLEDYNGLGNTLSDLGNHIGSGDNNAVSRDMESLSQKLNSISEQEDASSKGVDKLVSSIGDAQNRFSEMQYGNQPPMQLQEQGAVRKSTAVNTPTGEKNNKTRTENNGAGQSGKQEGAVEVTETDALGDSQTISTGSGTKVPYGAVLNNYSEDAMNSIQADSIPSGLKDVVRDYFSSLK